MGWLRLRWPPGPPGCQGKKRLQSCLSEESRSTTWPCRAMALKAAPLLPVQGGLSQAASVCLGGGCPEGGGQHARHRAHLVCAERKGGGRAWRSCPATAVVWPLSLLQPPLWPRLSYLPERVTWRYMVVKPLSPLPRSPDCEEASVVPLPTLTHLPQGTESLLFRIASS